MSKNAQYVKGVALPGKLDADVIAAFRKRSRSEGAHLVWTGTVDHRTTPVLIRQGARYPALQVAWVLLHGTVPQGHVRSSCPVPLCVAGRCLTDRVMRQGEQRLMAEVLGVDFSGTCRQGHARAEHGAVTLRGKVECRACDSARRRAQRKGCGEAAA
jgi:hypothetical protein